MTTPISQSTILDAELQSVQNASEQGLITPEDREAQYATATDSVVLENAPAETTGTVIDAETATPEPELSEGEKVAIRNYSMNYGEFARSLAELNGQAAKRVLQAIVSPGTDWQLHKHTTELEKKVFQLAARLMDSKIIMMLAALDKQQEALNNNTTSEAPTNFEAGEVILGENTNGES